MDTATEFKKIAPYIANRVRERITDNMPDEAIMKLIHAEIMEHFANQQQMFMQYLNFTADQRRMFAAAMYDALTPLAEKLETTVNPLYAAYVERTGNTGALNYMTGR
ncbi:hypothetical protein [Pantoea sp. 1.19]|uniref:hypothetical protein n=1 Tax=Pantoea sp. 1.19 TaxID=1925589 RepID=UPI000948F062|nr:hypothetical protein [Pantoea sp. 1.19]